MEESVVHPVIEVIGSIVLFVVGLFVKSHNQRITDIEEDAEENSKGLSDFKLDAEKRFAKDETVQASLSRIHDRLDKLPNEIRALLYHPPAGNGNH